MVPAKTRPMNVVLRSPWSARENPPQDLGYPVGPGNADEGQGTQTGTRKLVPIRVVSFRWCLTQKFLTIRSPTSFRVTCPPCKIGFPVLGCFETHDKHRAGQCNPETSRTPTSAGTLEHRDMEPRAERWLKPAREFAALW